MPNHCDKIKFSVIHKHVSHNNSLYSDLFKEINFCLQKVKFSLFSRNITCMSKTNINRTFGDVIRLLKSRVSGTQTLPKS